MFVTVRENNISYKLQIHRIQDIFIFFMIYYFYYPGLKNGSKKFYLQTIYTYVYSIHFKFINVDYVLCFSSSAILKS